MNTHYRNYQILVNGKPLPFFHSVEGISTDYIEKSKQNCINEQKKIGRIKNGDDVKFIFKYCNS